MKRYLCLVILIYVQSVTFGQTAGTVKSLDPALTKFFTGRWLGAGEFATGKKINAELSFALSLDSAWLEGSHTDNPPNKYKAELYWGVDTETGEFVAYTFDNFHGHRSFTTGGWKNNRLVLTTQQYYAQYGMFYQHFIYEKLTDDSFKMTYETSTDAITWKLGDWLLFKRA